ncbi:MAG: hypothetical protein ISS61_09700 [Desulfobacteraceae bacterium]|nr:hypothetical protein [Desulfobacteraceae bacterium]
MGYLKDLFGQTIVFLILFFLPLSPGVSQARFITIDTRVETKLQDDKLTITVELTNRGDELAYNLVVTTEIGGHSQAGRPIEKLEVGEVSKSQFNLDISFDKPGAYPLITRIDFTDVNQYPFSFLSLTDLIYGEGGPPKILAKMKPLEMAKDGKLHLTVKNLDANQKEINVRLIIPKEITPKDGLHVLKLEPLAEQTLDFPVSNSSALVGADYAIYALLAYEDAGRHYFTSAAGSIKIIEKKKLTRQQVYLLFGIPLGIFMLYLFFILRKKQKRRTADGS